MRQSVIHSSLHRHNHILGAERELVMLLGLFCVVIAFGSITKFAVISMSIIWLIGVYFLRLMAKKDPLMSRVYLRHIKYQNWYSARTSAWRVLEGFKVSK